MAGGHKVFSENVFTLMGSKAAFCLCLTVMTDLDLPAIYDLYQTDRQSDRPGDTVITTDRFVSVHINFYK